MKFCWENPPADSPSLAPFFDIGCFLLTQFNFDHYWHTHTHTRICIHMNKCTIIAAALGEVPLVCSSLVQSISENTPGNPRHKCLPSGTEAPIVSDIWLPSWDDFQGSPCWEQNVTQRQLGALQRDPVLASPPLKIPLSQFLLCRAWKQLLH